MVAFVNAKQSFRMSVTPFTGNVSCAAATIQTMQHSNNNFKCFIEKLIGEIKAINLKEFIFPVNKNISVVKEEEKIFFML